MWHNHSWNLSSLYTILPDNIKRVIDAIPFVKNSDLLDNMTWIENSSGIYTPRTTYSWLLSKSRPPLSTDSWTWIWKLASSEKIKLFVWQICQNALPTNLLRLNCNLSSSTSCSRCLGPEESVAHCLRDCNQLNRIWEALGFHNDPIFFRRTWWTGFRSSHQKKTLFYSLLQSGGSVEHGIVRCWSTKA